MPITDRSRLRALTTPRRRWVARVAVVLLLGSILSLPAGVSATPGTDDYPGRLKIAAQDALVDPWMFYNRECTSFVAWRLNNDNGIAFHNYYLGVHWGDASNWRNAAVKAGVPVDSVPTRGSIAWWAAGSAGSSRGHVAWVRSVSTSAITIEEYNYLTRGRYDTRTIYRTSSLYPTGFIHVGQSTTLKNTARPTIAGTAKVGQRLTANRGSWSMTGLDFTFQWMADGAPIAGATSKGLRLAADQHGSKIQVRVSATKPGGRKVYAASDATNKTRLGLFTAGDAPTISGTAKVGQALTATRGTWSPGGAAYGYRWYADDVLVPGATQATYTPIASQIGKAIRVEIVAARAGYKRAVNTSTATAKVVPGTFVNSVRPAIQGTPQVGAQLTASPGTWSPTGRYAYQWFADGIALAKATSATFTPAAAQLGKTLTVRVGTSKRGFTSATATSVVSKAVAPGAFVLARQPKIAGVAQVGMALTADSGSWSPKAQVSLQWLADGVAISGATGTSFTPAPKHLNQRITLRVTAKRTGYVTAVVTTAPTAAVRLGRIASLAAPTVSGSAFWGKTLRATPGSWSVAGVGVTYQWLRDGVAIRGATGRTYTTKRADRGHDLRVQVTATAPGYHHTTKQSSAVAILFGRISMPERPTITGTPAVGSKLLATAGPFKPVGAKVTYQWYRVDRAIAGATTRSYVPRKRDVGARLYVVVTVQAADWAPMSRGSLRTSAIRTAG